MADQATREGFLLWRTERFVGGVRKVRDTRAYCLLVGSRLECHTDVQDVAPERLQRYVRRRQPEMLLEMQECLEACAVPFTIEESVEKMRLRKAKNAPAALRLLMHGSAGSLEFAAEAGGDVRRWLVALKAAVWMGRPLAPGLEPARSTLIKVLFDGALDPKAPRKVVARQRGLVRAIVLQVDLSEATGAQVREAVSIASGMPPACVSLRLQGPPGKGVPRCLPRGWMDRPLEETLGPGARGQQRLVLLAQLCDFVPVARGGMLHSGRLRSTALVPWPR